MPFRKGHKAQFLVADGADVALGSLAAIGTIEVTSVNDSRATANIGTRGSDVDSALVGTRTINFTGTIRRTIATDTQFEIIREAYDDGTQITVAMLDGPAATAGSSGLRATVEVSQMNENQPMNDAISAEVVFQVVTLHGRETVSV